MFFGIELNTAKVHQSAFYVLTAYCVIYVCMHLCLEIYRRNNATKGKKKLDELQHISHLIKHDLADLYNKSVYSDRFGRNYIYHTSRRMRAHLVLTTLSL